jgi:hypothetical protein
LSHDDVARIMDTDRRNKWIPRGELRSARLREGLLNSRLSAELADGSGVKLLWLKSDPAFDVLRSSLGEWLGDALRVS